MNRVSLRWIIGLMSASLLALIAFQFYWIDTVISANEDRFRQDVMESLQAVAKKLEKREAVYLVNQQLQPLRQDFGTPFASSYQQSASMSFTWNDTLEAGESINFQFNLTDTGFYSTNSAATLEITQEIMVNGPDKIRRQIAAQENQYARQQYLQKVANKSDLVFDVLENMMVTERAIAKRIDPIELDSMLLLEFSQRGITTTYNYGVISPIQNRFVALKKAGQDEKLVSSDFRATLFPNDLFGDQHLLSVYFPSKTEFLFGKIWLTMASSGLLALIITFCFGYAAYTIIKQKKLSEMKNDFVNNMTHELKTPIATVGLAVEALRDNEIAKVASMHDRYLRVIDEENKRLGQHVEKVLQMATMEKNRIKLKLEYVDMHEVIAEAKKKMELQIERREGTIETYFNASKSIVRGDASHLMNVVMNLLDNANKYSPDIPRIAIRTENGTNKFTISVQDHGLGMSNESVKQIFQKFYRVPKGNLHDVKGFGLGLAYVKSVVDQHGGEVEVESDLGRGSKFYIILPLTDE
ncbi:MAG: HAMP domain-containing histidine kinase [Cyclobacteriaceae bacterium]|nr:HAMP domain-containing histidine kinase [Cyclobacteriaceae bacterium HetDA_MAG_MS6]